MRRNCCSVSKDTGLNQCSLVISSYVKSPRKRGRKGGRGEREGGREGGRGERGEGEREGEGRGREGGRGERDKSAGVGLDIHV